MVKRHDDDTEVFRISISTNRQAVASLLNHTEVTLSDDSVAVLARLISSVVVQLQSASSPAMTPKQRSEHANLGGQSLPTDMGLLIDTKEATKLLRVSSRKLWQMYNTGEMPKPIKIGRTVRWAYAELQAWVDAGCPATSQWKYEPH